MRRLTLLAGVVFMLVLTSAALADTVLACDGKVERAGHSALRNRSGKLVSMGWWPAWEKVSLSRAPWNSLTELVAFSMTTSTRAPYLDTTNHDMSPSFSRRFVSDAHAHRVKAILSIGGSDDQTWSTACSPAHREKLIRAAIGQMHKYRYDGIELDIEQGPWIGTRAFDSCIRSFHKSLKAKKTGARKAPILAYDEDPTWEDGDMRAVAPYLNQINLTDYGDTASGLPSVISALTSKGIPASKLVDGVGMDQGMTDYDNVSDVVAKAKWLSRKGVLGIGEWTTQDDYYNSGGSWPTFRALAPYVR